MFISMGSVIGNMSESFVIKKKYTASEHVNGVAQKGPPNLQFVTLL